MDQHFNLENEQAGSDWEQRFCLTDWCDAHLLFVQPDPMRPELWRVVPGEADTVFLVAAPTPICPLCGANLLTAANLEGGVGKIGKVARTT